MRLLNLFRRADSLKNLSPQEVTHLLEDFPKPVMIDVRTSFEFQAGHITDARHYSLGNELRGVQGLTPTTPIVLICKTGHRSQAAAHTLQENGFTNLYHLEGGMDRWRKENRPVEK